MPHESESIITTRATRMREEKFLLHPIRPEARVPIRVKRIQYSSHTRYGCPDVQLKLFQMSIFPKSIRKYHPQSQSWDHRVSGGPQKGESNEKELQKNKKQSQGGRCNSLTSSFS